MWLQAAAKVVLEACKKVKRCPHCDAVNGQIKKKGGMGFGHDIYSKKVSRGPCTCTGGMGTLHMHTRCLTCALLLGGGSSECGVRGQLHRGSETQFPDEPGRACHRAHTGGHGHTQGGMNTGILCWSMTGMTSMLRYSQGQCEHGEKGSSGPYRWPLPPLAPTTLSP